MQLRRVLPFVIATQRRSRTKVNMNKEQRKEIALRATQIVDPEHWWETLETRCEMKIEVDEGAVGVLAPSACWKLRLNEFHIHMSLCCAPPCQSATTKKS